MNTSLIILIVILVLILIIVGLVYYGVYTLKRKARNFSRQFLGTDSLKEGFSEIEKEYAQTPKSINAMTSLFLPRITRDFPDFSYDETKKREENLLTSYLLAIHNQDTKKLTDGTSDLQKKLENEIAILRNNDQRAHYDSIHLHRTEIGGYTKKDGRCIITFQSSIQYYYYITDSKGKIVKGSKDVLYQSRYNVDLIYVQDRSLVESNLDDTLGLNCPNCGAPITNLGQKFCEYCGTGIIELNIHAWSFSDVKEDK